MPPACSVRRAWRVELTEDQIDIWRGLKMTRCSTRQIKAEFGNDIFAWDVVNEEEDSPSFSFGYFSYLGHFWSLFPFLNHIGILLIESSRLTPLFMYPFFGRSEHKKRAMPLFNKISLTSIFLILFILIDIFKYETTIVRSAAASKRESLESRRLIKVVFNRWDF